MPRYRVIPYRAGSRGATALSRALGGLCLKIDGTSRFRPRRDDVIINWGNTNHNYPLAINAGNLTIASNKLRFFQRMTDTDNGDIIPAFWTRREDIPDDAFPIVCRTVLAGHSGEGIVIAATRDDLVPAPLYVKYIKKQDEYRIHVGIRWHLYEQDGHAESIIISQQRKARRRETPDEQVNWQVRNHANGFVYVRGDCNPPASVVDAARRALEATGLDFGAVDVIYNARTEQAYVLEINTAPGLEGQTLDDYVRFFRGN